MKIVIPTDDRNGLNSAVAEHFGRSETYTFLNGEGKVLEIIDNSSEHRGGQGLPPELMKKHGANILLCQGLGSRALGICNELGIDVYIHQAQTVKDIYALWKNNKLKPASEENACQH